MRKAEEDLWPSHPECIPLAPVDMCHLIDRRKAFGCVPLTPNRNPSSQPDWTRDTNASRLVLSLRPGHAFSTAPTEALAGLNRRWPVEIQARRTPIARVVRALRARRTSVRDE